MSTVVVYGNELYHHGVLGMRWGHRKQKYQKKINKLQSRNSELSQVRTKRAVKASKATSEAIRAAASSAKYRKKALKAEMGTGMNRFLSDDKRAAKASSLNDQTLLSVSRESGKSKKALDLQAKVADIDFSMYKNDRRIQKYMNKISKLDAKIAKSEYRDVGKAYIEERSKRAS